MVSPVFRALFPAVLQRINTARFFYRRLFTLFISIFFSSAVFSQNYFANPGFEETNICTEYKAPCAPEAWFYIKPTAIPIINTASPERFTGSEALWLPVQNIYHPDSMRQLVYTMLLCPLIKDQQYKLSFYLNTGGRPFYTTEIGFSTKEPATIGFETTDLLSMVPVTKQEVVAEMRKSGWKAVELTYTAVGGETFFVLGNISHEKYFFAPNERMSTTGMVYYFVDDIRLRPLAGSMPCPGADKILEKLFAQDYRHTDAHVTDPADVATSLITDTVTVPAVFFETDKAVLKPSFKRLLDSLIVTLQKKNLISLRIEGHTDNAGSPQHNMTLSALRAESVRNYISTKMPDASSDISAEGKGADYPVADNKTKPGMAKNRRVEIIVTYTVPRE